MEFIRGLNHIRPYHQECVITIGNFDGIHRGHQQLLDRLKKSASELQLPTLVITFEPQPNEYFFPEKTPPRLMRLREKIDALRKYNIDRMLCLFFNKELAEKTAESFIEDILIEKLRVRYIIVGDDFRFGRQRKGDIFLLKQYGEQHQFQVDSMDTHRVDNERVSSTRVREALEKGDLTLAKKLLGRSFRMSGRVAHGDKRGRIIGFPTANIYLHRRAVPILGVYAVKVHGIADQPLKGVANVGNRPTVDGTRSLLEVHLFDFNQEIYGKHVDVEFIYKLRDEKRFESFDLLKQQILKDAEVAKKFFETIPSPLAGEG